MVLNIFSAIIWVADTMLNSLYKLYRQSNLHASPFCFFKPRIQPSKHHTQLCLSDTPNVRCFPPPCQEKPCLSVTHFPKLTIPILGFVNSSHSLLHSPNPIFLIRGLLLGLVGTYWTLRLYLRKIMLSWIRGHLCMWISYLNETLAPNFESDTELPILSIDVSLS